ncbi:hypothetical protein BT69DRAFT_1347245 [Atractiella rhizophila]|nr:hypothetical protein BT69DRAFT_1347245 [Atractiella rhizophila]
MAASSTTATAAGSAALPSVDSLYNSFNAPDCVSYLQKGWQDAVARMHDSEIPPAEKPDIYKAPTQATAAWTGGAGAAWGSKANLTANGTDFLLSVWGGKGR